MRGKMKKRILSLILLGSMLLCSIFLVVRPASSQSTLSPGEVLFGAGVLWAANGGTRAAYVDWYDNLLAYPNPNCLSVDSYLPQRNEVISVLEGEGFTVDTFATIPDNLTMYSVVYLEAYFALTPADEPAIQSYISSGGGVVLQGGAICYLAYDSQTFNTGQDLSSVADWFGASYYVNTAANAYVAVANPLGTSLSLGEELYSVPGSGKGAITDMSADSQVLALYTDGNTFAFTHEYGQGRVYWQEDHDSPPTQQPPESSEALSLTLLGGFDYGATEQANVKVFAELRDAVTMEPISGANLTIQVYDPNDTLWVSASMFEAINGTGIYEWDSPNTVATMNLQPGVYIARVTASIGISSASEIIAFHIDPTPSSTGTTTLPSSTGTTKAPGSAGTTMLPFILAMIVALVLGGILIAQVLLRKAPKKPKEPST
jgi:hypothetical protein